MPVPESLSIAGRRKTPRSADIRDMNCRFAHTRDNNVDLSAFGLSEDWTEESLLDGFRTIKPERATEALQAFRQSHPDYKSGGITLVVHAGTSASSIRVTTEQALELVAGNPDAWWLTFSIISTGLFLSPKHLTEHQVGGTI